MAALSSFSKSNSLFPKVEHGVVTPHKHISQDPAHQFHTTKVTILNQQITKNVNQLVGRKRTKEVHVEEECRYR